MTMSSGSRCGRRLDQGPPGQRDLALELPGSMSRGLASLHPEHVAQHRRDGLGLLVPRAQHPEPGDQLGARHLQRIRRVHPVRVPEQRAEDAVGRLAQGGAGRAAHRNAGDPAVGAGAQAREELRDEARLARARLAHHAHHLRAALPHRGERGHELRELGGAAHQRRRQAERGQPPGRSRLRERAQHAMHHDGLGLALCRHRARGLEGKGVLGEPIRGLGHQDGPGRRRRQ
jgi:hypothetical protein